MPYEVSQWQLEALASDLMEQSAKEIEYFRFNPLAYAAGIQVTPVEKVDSLKYSLHSIAVLWP